MTRHTDAASSPQPQAGGLSSFTPACTYSRALTAALEAGNLSPVNLPPDCFTASGGTFGASYMGAVWQLNEIRKASQ